MLQNEQTAYFLSSVMKAMRGALYYFGNVTKNE
jgi:hypothetical protein